jgi:hypothetical protein
VLRIAEKTARTVADAREIPTLEEGIDQDLAIRT